MTKFGEEFTYNCISIQPFLRLPISFSSEKCFLINDGRKSVVKVHDRKLMHSWTLTHPHSFTCPVTFNSEDESIYCVMNNKTLLKWSLDDEVLKSATKFKFQQPIFAVLPVSGQNPVLLFTSGKVVKGDTLTSHPEPMGQAFIDKEEEIIWADTVHEHSNAKVVCLGFFKKDNTYKLHCFTVSENSVADYHEQHLLHGTDALRNWCLNKNTCSFLAIWSSGVVINYQLGSQVQSALISIPNIEKHHLLAIDSIDSNHIVVMKSNAKLKEACLEIWDIKFQAVKAKLDLKIGSPTFIQLCVTDSIIFLSQNEELMEVSFHAEKSTLAAVIGKSLTATAEVKEFCWNKGKVTQLSTQEQDTVEKMDISETEQSPLNSTELIAHKLMDKGHDYLNYIPESELVRLLRLAMRYKFKEKGNMTNIEPDTILNAIFSASFSDVFLMKFLKKLSQEDTMETLEVLLSFLKNKVSSENIIQVKPSDFQLFNWICLVIQSHMEALLLSKDKKCAKLLRKLDSCLSEKMQEYQEYENIQHLFLVIQNKKNVLPENYVAGKYCIETLNI